jgi:hypothetical protein
MFKMPKSTRGISKTKFPDRRWVIIIDFVSDESILTRELKNAIKSAKEGMKGKKNATVGEDLVVQKAKAKVKSSTGSIEVDVTPSRATMTLEVAPKIESPTAEEPNSH